MPKSIPIPKFTNLIDYLVLLNYSFNYLYFK